MDVEAILTALKADKDRIAETIAALEVLLPAGGPHPVASPSGKKRGRKSMGSDERLEVSARMKNYWAGRRAQRQKHA